MENNNTNISEVTSEETQNKKEAVEQTSSTQGTSTTKKVVDSAGENSNLYLRRSSVFLIGAIALNDTLLQFFLHYVHLHNYLAVTRQRSGENSEIGIKTP